jgi:hypothetical protein
MAEGRSTWFYVGVGCLALFVVCVLGAVAGGFWIYRTARQFEAQQADPDARTAKVLRILNGDRIPDGYHAVVGFSVPYVMDVAILSDEAPDPDGRMEDLGDRALIYVQMIRTGQDEQALRDWFLGRTTDPKVLADNHINVDVDEIVGRGVLELNGASLMYLAQRGRVTTQGYSGSGIASIVLIDCPADDRTRMAIWIVPDEKPDVPVAEVDWTGTPADPEELGRFLGGFRFCPTG